MARSSSLMTIIVSVLLLLGTHCKAVGPTVVTKESDISTLLKFREWMESADTVMPSPRRYEVRRSRNASRPGLIFTTVAYADYPPKDQWYESDAPSRLYSSNYYAVSLAGGHDSTLR